MLVEVIVMQSALEYMLREEIASQISSHPILYSQIFVTDDTNNPTRTLEISDLKGRHDIDLVEILYQIDQKRTILIVGSLLLAGALLGFLIASIAFRHLLAFGDRVTRLSVMDKVCIFSGIVVGALLSAIVTPVLPGAPPVRALLALIITYLCIWLFTTMKEELKFYFPTLSKSQEVEKAFQKPKILDTNVIIDGRIADICNAGFVEGQIVVPSFVIDELQHIADSGESIRRARGRRGLDVLNQMRKDLGLQITQTVTINPENPEEVDARLVKLAKEIGGIIVTNDFNLNKVAALLDVPVLNVNELANALKPVLLPGEELSINIIKEGKEINQGIGYLDDGTMIVVEGAKKHVGEVCDVTVASVLQTVAGKMIFANLKSNQEQEDAIIDRNVRNYSNFRPRRKAN